MAKKKSAVTDEAGAQFEVVPAVDSWDVATAYALLADGDLPPVLRGDDLEDA